MKLYISQIEQHGRMDHGHGIFLTEEAAILDQLKHIQMVHHHEGCLVQIGAIEEDEFGCPEAKFTIQGRTGRVWATEMMLDQSAIRGIGAEIARASRKAWEELA